MPPSLDWPQTHLFRNLELAAQRFPEKPGIVFYDSVLTYAAMRSEAESLAGHLQAVCGVCRGDRVLLMMQNSPQWILGYYAILRADAVVVPVNPMNRLEELRHLVADSGARTALVAQDLLDEVMPLLRDGTGGLEHLIVATYSDHLTAATDLPVPDFVTAPRRVDAFAPPGVVAWADARIAGHRPAPMACGPEDPCALPYTSGTTGAPKGCLHTHRSVMATAVGGVAWFGRGPDSVYLACLPFFHVTGMSGSMNGPIFAGATLVVMARWDRRAALACMSRWRVDTWQCITAMVVDFLAEPDLEAHDLSALRVVRGGGAAMPEAVAMRMRQLVGVDYIEGYGLSETLAATHLNPPHRPKAQCLGIPVFDVDARIVDPETLQERPVGEPGELVIHGPQVMVGYWNAPHADAQAFVQIDGKRFLRTGDLARVDEDGYYFMTDRLKRMINASGYKVWPAEVEALMYRHPAVLEACVVGVPDKKRGETVKAHVVLREDHPVEAEALMAWCRVNMAAYKVPRIVAFASALPKSASGKILWRVLQDQDREASLWPREIGVN